MKKGSQRNDAMLIEEILSRGLNNLNNNMADLTRRAVAVLLAHEVNTKRRDDYVKRLHQRLASLRRNDELKQLRKAQDTNAIDWLKQEVANPA